MSASEGICLHQIIGELEQIEKSIVMNKFIAEEDAKIFLNQHLTEIRELILNIESV